MARVLFNGFWVILIIIFIILFLNTYNHYQNNENAISREVLSGKKIFRKNYCQGCHSLFGEGAYYAPDLTKIVTKRNTEFIHDFLRFPQPAISGEIRMIQYDFTHTEIDDIILFLLWSENKASEDFPPQPKLIINNELR